MLILKVDGKTIDIKYNYRFYMNVVGNEEKNQDENFDVFISGLINDRADSLLKFGVAMSNRKLSMEQVADQLDEEEVFNDIHAATDEVLKGMCSAGFLTLKVREWKKYAKTMTEGFEKAYKATLKKNSELSEDKKEDPEELAGMKLAVNQAKEQIKTAEERLAM